MKRIMISLVACLTTAALPAQEGGLDIRGSVQDNTVLLQDAEAGDLAYAGYVRVSLSAQNKDRENAKLDLDASVSLLYGRYADAFLAPISAAGFGAVPALNAAVELDIRKLSLSLYLGPVDLTVGRKIVNWGYGRVFSPADAYSSIDLGDISLRRTGSDLLMAEVYFTDATGAGLIISPTSDMTGFKAGGKFFTNLLDFDASLIGVYRDAEADLILGTAVKGTVPVLDIGLTMEGIRHIVPEGEDGWFEAMVGLDYSFFDRVLIVMAEYYFNERPIDAASLSPVELAAVDRAFWGRHYVFGSAQLVMFDVFVVSASALTNIETLAAIAALQLSAGIFDNTFISGAVRAFSGDVNSIPGVAGLRLSYGLSIEIRF